MPVPDEVTDVGGDDERADKEKLKIFEKFLKWIIFDLESVKA